MSKGSNSVWQRFAKDNSKSEHDEDTKVDKKPESKKPEDEKPKESKPFEKDVENVDEPLNMTGKHLLNLLKDVLPPEITDALSKLEGDVPASGDGGGAKVVIVRKVNESPFDAISDDDFVSDPVVDSFKNQGGCNIVRAALKEGSNLSLGWLNRLSEDLGEIREASHNAALRTIFACVHSAKTKREASHQVQAVKLLDWLIKDVNTEYDKANLEQARRSVLSGTYDDFDAANFRVRNVFASRIPQGQMLRTAYTTLSGQDGEGYQMCPKAQYQIGRALPMEISKCRDNCIDSRVTREGKVTCAYAEWLRVADNHNSAMNRLDVVKHDLNDATRMELKGKDRGKLEEPDSLEGMIDKKRNGLTIDTCYDEALDSKDAGGYKHKGEKGEKRLQDEKDNKKELDHIELRLDKQHTDDADNDEILDQLLEEYRDGSMDDDDLDKCAEELISKMHTNKA